MSVPRRPIRVLQLRDSPWIDGPGRTILETASHIDRMHIDYQVGIFVAAAGKGHPLVEELRKRGLPVHEVVDDGTSLRSVVERVVALIDMLGIEILHTSEVRSNAIGLMCRKRRPALLVSTAHGWIANDLRGKVKTLLDRILLRQFDRVILVSHAMRQHLPRWLVPDRRVSVIHNALPLESYGVGFRARRRDGPVPGQEINLLVVGRLATEKGVDRLLQAIASIATEVPEIRLLIAGTGPCASPLRAQAEKLGIGDKVKWCGYITDMTSLYSQADLVVQSSLTEGLPNVMLEAAYLGVPVVATDVGGTREVVEHGVSGWLVRAGSAQGLADGIREFLRRPAKFAEMASRGRQRIVERFSFEARTAKQMALYEELAGKSG